MPTPRLEATDEDLVARMRAGDDESGRILFERMFPTLRPLLRHKLGPALRRKVGESDVIQSTYMAIVRRLDEFSDLGPGSFRRWLVGVLDNKLLEEFRRYHGTAKRDPRREVGLDALSENSAPRESGQTPSHAAISAEDLRRVGVAMAALEPDHRTVLLLLHERGLSLSDAAQAMGRSQGAIRKLHARAVACMAEILDVGGSA